MSKQKTPTASKSAPLNSENFESYWIGYTQSIAGRKVSWWINEKKFTAKETDISYRTLNHWSEIGLIDDEREEGKGWRKFSILDVVWIHVISALRNFGFSMEQLLKAKTSLLETTYEFDDANRPSVLENMQISAFEFYLATALMHKTAVFLRVLESGESEMLTYEEYQYEITNSELAHHLIIDLTLIIRKIFPSSSYTPQYGPTEELSSEEMEVLFMLRTGNFHRITARKKGGKITMIEAEEFITGKTHVDILKEEDYQKVEITKQDGKTVNVRRKVLKKL